LAHAGSGAHGGRSRKLRRRGEEGPDQVAYPGQLIGDHPSIEETRRLIAKVARSPARCVLIYGETGTGKGLVARMIHHLSSRARGELVDVNCAAIPANLLESELFGHERGAFTGAAAKKTGLIEIADGGTMFLDEIREMDLTLQAKLLTLLDTQRLRRLGATRPIEVDVRFVAATNKILFAEVKAGKFREDLYYRLQVVAINIPPLRERGDDVLVLTGYFLETLGARYRRVIKGLEPAVEDLFKRYSWPGNVRELENLLERIFVLEEEDRVLVRHVPPRILREVNGERVAPPVVGVARREVESLSFREATASFQRRLIEQALERAGGNPTRAARTLGLSRHALRHQMGKLGLR
jgi:transcriptional regulator with PAS, ATPase and Fis domain